MKLGYPDREAERAILTQHRAGEPVDDLKPVLQPADILALQTHTRSVRVDPAIADYILDLVNQTRTHAEVLLGASTRAALALYRAAQALAVTVGRDYVVPDDVKRLAEPVLAHRLVTRGWTSGRAPGRRPGRPRNPHANQGAVVRRTTERSDTPTPAGRLVLTGEGLAWLGGTLLLGVVGWFKSINLVLLLAYLMADSALLEWAPCSHASPSRHGRPRCSASGRTREKTHRPRHRDATSARGRRLSAVEDSRGRRRLGWLVHRLAAGGDHAHCSAACSHGLADGLPVALLVSSGFPLGLVRFDRVSPTDSELVVLPAAGVAEADGLRQWMLRQAGGDGRCGRFCAA